MTWGDQMALARQRGSYALAYQRGPLTNAEKDYIGKAWAENQTVREIATFLRRHHSTVRNVFNIHEGKPTLSLSKVLTPAEFDRGCNAVCLDCGFDRIEFDTDGNGLGFDRCPKCKWTRYFGRATVAPETTNAA